MFSIHTQKAEFLRICPVLTPVFYSHLFYSITSTFLNFNLSRFSKTIYKIHKPFLSACSQLNLIL